jgi:hypothetical protein
MPSEIRVNPAARSALNESGVTDSGLASVVISASALSPHTLSMPSRRRPSSPGGSSVGVPPPTNTVSTRVGVTSSAARASSASIVST